MLFNSIEFVLFLPIVFGLYWFVTRTVRNQNVLLLVASYVFYGWWDWRFLALIFVSSSVDYVVGLALDLSDNPTRRKRLLGLSLGVNLGFLGFFKYFNFFLDSLVDAFASLGLDLHPRSLSIILPVGISFYTFQTLSYTIDIYRQRIEPTRDVVAFFAFVAFFPQLVAGPIERAANLLPQFERTRRFDYSAAREGLRHILWGLTKKVIVADTCARAADRIFGSYETASGSTLVLGAVFFAFQIYGDFSGYSDVAIGTARLFGFRLTRNFALPYFSRDITEFWHRWHISLSSWFRDYVYIPLGGSRCGTAVQVRNILLTFTISGLWHGANWTFLFWGFLNGLYYLPLILIRRRRSDGEIVAHDRRWPRLAEVGQISLTFALTLVGWVFFRSQSLDSAVGYLRGMFSSSLFSIPDVDMVAISAIIGLLAAEWLQRTKRSALDLDDLPLPIRWGLYYGLLYGVIEFWHLGKTFIYFQF